MSAKTDRSEIDTTIGPDGQQRDYLVLPEEDRAKGFVRPVRRSYRHTGTSGPKHPLRDLTAEEAERYAVSGYAKFEAYPPGHAHGSVVGRYWTQAQLDAVGKGCGETTTMGHAIAETYARDPYFYSGTFCATCRSHFPVGDGGEFVWVGDGSKVGT